MMKQRILPKISLFILMLLYFFSFNKCSNPVDDNIVYSYRMFYLADSTISYSTAENLPINSLILQADPFITDLDIKNFRVLYLDDNPIQSYHIILSDSIDSNFSNDVRPFVMILNGDRYCVAEYCPSFMSIVPKSIHMYRMLATDLQLHPGDSIGNSKLKNPKIFEALEELSVEIQYVNIGGN